MGRMKDLLIEFEERGLDPVEGWSRMMLMTMKEFEIWKSQSTSPTLRATQEWNVPFSYRNRNWRGIFVLPAEPTKEEAQRYMPPKYKNCIDGYLDQKQELPSDLTCLGRVEFSTPGTENYLHDLPFLEQTDEPQDNPGEKNKVLGTRDPDKFLREQRDKIFRDMAR